MYEIVIGRSESDLKQFGLKGTIFLGKHYVRMGQTTSLSNKVYMDVAKSHVVLVSGKRGTGKCIKPKSKVLLDNKKVKSIESLFSKIKKTGEILVNKGNEQLIKSNEKISVVSLDNMKLTTQKITHAYRVKIDEEIYVIKTKTKKKIEATREHPLLIYQNSIFKWVTAENLKTNDDLITIDLKKENPIIFDKITEIKKKRYSDVVYDLTIENTHNFIANDIVCHNSYTLGVIAEEMSNLPEEIANNLSVLIFDTMGIYWTMKFKNEKDEELLAQWGLPKKGLNVNIYTPKGFHQKYKEKNIPTDFPFSIKPSELNSGDWCSAFDIKITDPVGVLIERALSDLQKRDYSIQDIINFIKTDEKTDEKTKLAAENRFTAAESWGLFDVEGTPIKEIVDNGKVTVLDLSTYTNISGNWGIKGLVVGLICKKLFLERMASRKEEEMEDVESGHSYFLYKKERTKEEMPLVWILLDEAHEMLPRDYTTPATEALVQLLREGRQPGISLVLATQQPGEIHKDVTTQTDMVISHRVTAKRDIEALNSMMHGYVTGEIQKYLNILPKETGSAVILDDNSEKLYPIRVRPRFTWHGGEAPSAIKYKGKTLEELGL